MNLAIAIIVLGQLEAWANYGPQDMDECQIVADAIARQMEETLDLPVRTICMWRTEGGGVPV